MPRVFISYSHDSDEHREWVLGLSERLRADGLETHLDRYVNGTPAEGWPRWMLDQVDAADFVLVVCTETYYRRFRGHEERGRGKGVDWEGALITQELYDSHSETTKFVPVMLDGNPSNCVPEPLRGQTLYRLTSTSERYLDPKRYQDLLDFLLGQSGVEPGEVGEPKKKRRRRAAPLPVDEAPKPEPSQQDLLTQAARFQIPPPKRDFTGRDNELAELRTQVRNHGGALNYGVRGLGGVGKTELASKLAEEFGDEYPKRFLLLAAAPDGQRLRDRVADLLAGEGHVSTDPTAFPGGRDASRPTVALVIVSPGVEGALDVLDFLDEAIRRRLKIVPVVDDLRGFDFTRYSRPELQARNAVGVEPDDGDKLRRTVRGYFGLDAFPEKKKLFLSYARHDGETVAKAIYDDLWKHHFTVFRDVEQIEGGADVQERIMEQIGDKDFVLLIDTPAARRSHWVEKEIVEAQSRRIPVRVLQIGLKDPCPLMPNVERMRWKDPTPKTKRLAKVRQFVAQGIGGTASFDERAERLLAEIAEIEGLRLERPDRRRLLLAGRGHRVLFDVDRTLPSLEGLHRLYLGYRETGKCRAVLVSGDDEIGETTTAAVSWARGRAPLEVTSLLDLKTVLDRHFG